MPCTISKEEVEWYEKEENQKTFGLKLTDDDILEEVACAACRTLQQLGKLYLAPKLVQKWWELHTKKDLEKAKQESAEKKKKELKQKALLKLSKEEKEALGI
jgi:hypothetical protein